MNSSQPPQTAAKSSHRPPPRLRTKTGCYKCRERRKKCDELRPICSACERLDLSCTYPDDLSDNDHGTAQRSPSVSSIEQLGTPQYSPQPLQLCTPIWNKPQGLSTQQDYLIFQYCSTRYNRLLINPEAPSSLQDISFVFAIGYDSPWVVHAALAPAALHASFRNLVPRSAAISYTQSALYGLQQVIQTYNEQYEWKQMFMATSIFMGLFEDFYVSPSSHSLVHFKAVAEVLEILMKDVDEFHISDLTVFERILLDSVLYHYSTRLISLPDIEVVCSSFPSATMAKYIRAYQTEAKFNSANPPILPVLGKLPPSLFILIFHVTWLSRHLPDAGKQPNTMVHECRKEFDRIEHELQHYLPDNVDDMNNGDIAAWLYVMTFDIFLSKVQYPQSFSSTSPLVQLTLNRIHVLLQAFQAAEPYSQFICWPILILGCAACPITISEANDAETKTQESIARVTVRRTIRFKLQEIWKSSFSGYVKRCIDVLERLWSPSWQLLLNSTCEQQQAHQEPDTLCFDGLNALILKQGLSAI